MRTLTVVLLLIVAMAGAAIGQATRFDLHRLYSGHRDVLTNKETQTVTSLETTSGQTIYQVFYSRAEPRRELFRAPIGVVVATESVRFWNYGIVNEGDFNGDGRRDYFWYGGDDSGSAMYLFLSSRRGYSKVDIHQTLKAAWKRRLNRDSPEWANLDSEYLIGEISIERGAAEVVLLVTVEPGVLNNVDKDSYQFRIKPPDFK
jgi:hypothetical protein